MTWRLKSDVPFGLKTTPLFDVVGKDIAQYLPEGNNYWRQLQVEVEMAFHQVSSAQCNYGLWMWGESSSQIVEEKTIPFTHIYGQDDWIKNFSNQFQIPYSNIDLFNAKQLKPGNYGIFLELLDVFVDADSNDSFSPAFCKIFSHNMDKILQNWYLRKINTINLNFLGHEPISLFKRPLDFFRRFYDSNYRITKTQDHCTSG